MDTFASRSLKRPATAPASLTGRSAITNANAPGSNSSDCFDVCVAIVALTLPVAPTNVIVALAAGETVTVCNGGAVIIAGLMFNVAVLDPLIGAMTTNA